jgi:hypothetical protein
LRCFIGFLWTHTSWAFGNDAISSLIAEISSSGELYNISDIRFLSIPKRKKYSEMDLDCKLGHKIDGLLLQ